MNFPINDLYNEELESWKRYFQQQQLDTLDYDKLLLYITPLITKGLPIIFDFKHLALHLVLPNEELRILINDISTYYRTFYIKKKNGTDREIVAPYPKLAYCQRWIYNNILLKVQIHKKATGFVKGKSIVNNAQTHLENNYILKLDIEDFFPSIKEKQVFSIFKKMGYSSTVSKCLSLLCTLDNALPQGASTSPCISNIILIGLDEQLDEYASNTGLKYSRYADDITISAKYNFKNVHQEIINIIESFNFKINIEKKKYIGRTGRKIITGISITGGKLTIPIQSKRNIRHVVYFLLKNGLLKHQENIKSRDPLYLERVIGRLYFWKSVEPENKYVISSIKSLEQMNRDLKEEFANLHISNL